MARARFAPPSLQDGATPTDRVVFGARTQARTPSFQPFHVGGDAPIGKVPLGATLDDVGGAGPAANDMGPGPELEHLRQQAKLEGMAEGIELGRQEARAEAAQLLDMYKRAIEQLSTLQSSIVEAYREQLSDVAIAVAEAVIQDAVDDGSVVRGLAARALESFAGNDAIEVIVAPDDAEHLEDWASSRRDAGLDLTLRVDDALQPGDLRARCEGGSLETRLADRTKRALQAVRGAASDGDADRG